MKRPVNIRLTEANYTTLQSVAKQLNVPLYRLLVAILTEYAQRATRKQDKEG